ncbi:uncharacterized protein LOC135476546 [Liolophura sinensis]|uniref:uncharacterized protein LOC135476546 n=1 Tax=Liolophura sinensis TaxID=3198878 RepID=UPI0031594B33
MRVVIFVLVAVCIVAVAVGKRFCSSQNDCLKGECCRNNQLRGKRSVYGVCEPLGNAGSNCYLSLFQVSEGVYSSCPCVRGLECKGSGLVEVPYGEMGTCVRPSCKSAADCGPDECCVNPNRPRGKKKRSTGYVCQSMKNIGDGCLVSYGSGVPSSVGFMCPCKAGLTCTPSGYSDMPLGPMGTCTSGLVEKLSPR